MPAKPTAKKKFDLIIEQDGKCCLIEWGLCLMPDAILSLVVKSKTYATWEHLTPRSRGGNGSAANLRLSHKACNNARRSAPLPGYQEKPAAREPSGYQEKPAAREPFVLIEGMGEPEPFTSAWLRWKGYL